ncbi:MAG: carboxypeptidase-like regulatory domain-containing protein [Proteiniphilum sp.]
MKIIQLPRRGRVGLSLTIQFMAVFVVLGTVNGFAGNTVHNPHNLHTPFVAQQQRRTDSGTVTDTNGEAVIGANVMEKGTTNGTVTDSDGRFLLTIESGGVLLVSYIGYLGQEINTAGRSSFDIVLREDSRSLEEVVVVGYGTQKKVNLTGALASVGRDEVKPISSANLVTGLAGKLPGLKVTQRTGKPGGYTTSYDIRGFGAPLIVVDGIVGDGADFARLDPHDIKSITILKDVLAAVQNPFLGLPHFTRYAGHF